MLTKAEVASALAVFCQIHGRQLEDALIGAYHGILAPHFDTETWRRACREVAETCRFWPAPAVFLEGRQREQAANVASLAETAWAAALNDRRCQHYNAQVGTRYDAELLAARFGEEAGFALRASGLHGRPLLADERALSFTRKTFVEAFERRYRANRQKALPPGATGEELEAARSAQAQLSSGEAKNFLRELERRGGKRLFGRQP